MKRHSLFVVLLFTLALRFAFLNQAIQGDDVYYLAGAQHALIDPLHPHHAHYAFDGEMRDMRGHPHPPLNTWILAGLLALFGDVHETWFHAAYTLFSLLAVGAVWWMARRFHAPPVLSALLVAVVPAFVISGSSLEADLPLLAFLMCGVALFVRAVDKDAGRWLIASAVALVLASMTGYQSILITPILALYLWFHANRRWWNRVVAAVPVLTIGAWQAYERITSGAVPLAVLHGYTSQYGFEGLNVKLRSAMALTVHTGWIVFPALAVVAFLPRKRIVLVAIVVVSACLAVLDVNLLFWVSFGVGLMVVARCAVLVSKNAHKGEKRAVLVGSSIPFGGTRPDPEEIQVRATTILRALDADERFLAAWVLLFFGGALVGAYAGAERYLLPIAAPVAILTGRFFAKRQRWLVAGLACQCAVSLALAFVNYQHWDAYRQFVARHRDEIQSHRTWVAAEWGLRFYAESEGALPPLTNTRVDPDDLVLTSVLSGSALATRGDLVPIDRQEVVPTLPLRLIGLHSRSGFQTASAGLREFDISTEPVDIVAEQKIPDREPTASWLPMNSPAAVYQIVSGAYALEANAWRWVGATAMFRLRTPMNAGRFAADIFVPAEVVPCTVTLSVNGTVIAMATYTASAKYELTGTIAGMLPEVVTATLSTNHTFHAPNDARDLGLVLSAIGFAPDTPADQPH
jgi:Dolichyl-phosphate-mannose-protein mannosyltransferase